MNEERSALGSIVGNAEIAYREHVVIEVSYQKGLILISLLHGPALLIPLGHVCPYCFRSPIFVILWSHDHLFR